MDYVSIYKKIVVRGQNRKKPEFSENHHIVPKAFGGSNDKINLVYLTPREHYICHLLLYRINKNDKRKAHQMLTAVIMMRSRFVVNSKLYEKARIEYCKYKSMFSKGENNPMFGKKHSEETKKLLSEKAKKRKSKHPMLGKKHSKESILKNKLSNSLHIGIFNDINELVMESKLKFEDFCLENNLPYRAFKISTQKNGEKIYTKKPPRNKDWIKYKGWYAKTLS